MSPFKPYHWSGHQASFENMMSFAWYLYVEDKGKWIRDEATSSLRMIKLAADMQGLAGKPLHEVTVPDLVAIKSVFMEKGVNRGGAQIALLYLLKFLTLLNQNKCFDLNVIEIAARL